MSAGIRQGQLALIIWILALVLVGLGIYLFALAGRMREEKKVSEFLIPATELYKIQDMEGLADYLSDRVRILSIACMVFGLVLILYQLIHFPAYIAVAFALALLIVYLWFSRGLREGVKRF